MGSYCDLRSLQYNLYNYAAHRYSLRFAPFVRLLFVVRASQPVCFKIQGFQASSSEAPVPRVCAVGSPPFRLFTEHGEANCKPCVLCRTVPALADLVRCSTILSCTATLSNRLSLTSLGSQMQKDIISLVWCTSHHDQTPSIPFICCLISHLVN